MTNEEKYQVYKYKKIFRYITIVLSLVTITLEAFALFRVISFIWGLATFSLLYIAKYFWANPTFFSKTKKTSKKNKKTEEEKIEKTKSKKNTKKSTK